MNIAFFVNEFPSISETFVLSQIVGLVEAGHRVDIYARNPQKTAKTHPLFEKFQLQDSVCYHPLVPGDYITRFLKGLWLFTVCFRRNPRIALASINVIKFGKHAASLKLLYRAIPMVQRNCPIYDIIMCHFGPMGLMALDLMTLGAIKGKLCVTFHGLDLSAFLKEAGKTVYDPLFSKGDLMLPISEKWRNCLIDLGCPAEKIRVHRMGVDAQKFKFKARVRRPGEPVRIVTIARLVEKKGVEYGIRAIAQIKHLHPDIEYWVIGGGPLTESLTDLIDDLSVADTVKLLGWQSQAEVINILSQAHLLIAPSVTSQSGDMEGIPVVLMEAMAMGLPVVSTYHSGIPELVEDGVTGFLVPERDSQALADRICCLIDQADQWPAMGQQGRDRIEAEYENAGLNHRLNAIFSALAAGQDPNASIPENMSSPC